MEEHQDHCHYSPKRKDTVEQVSTSSLIPGSRRPLDTAVQCPWSIHSKVDMITTPTIQEELQVSDKPCSGDSEFSRLEELRCKSSTAETPAPDIHQQSMALRAPPGLEPVLQRCGIVMEKPDKLSQESYAPFPNEVGGSFLKRTPEGVTDIGQISVSTEAAVAEPQMDYIRHRTESISESVQKSSGNAAAFLKTANIVDKHRQSADEVSGHWVLWLGIYVRAPGA